jgi:hypothetical protein
MKLEPKEVYYISALYMNKIATLLLNAGETIVKSSDISDSTKGEVLPMLNEVLQTRNFVFEILKTPFLDEDYTTDSLQLIKTGLSGYSPMLDTIFEDTKKQLETSTAEGEEKENQVKMLDALVNEKAILKSILDKLEDVAIVPEVVEEPKQIIVE